LKSQKTTNTATTSGEHNHNFKTNEEPQAFKYSIMEWQQTHKKKNQSSNPCQNHPIFQKVLFPNSSPSLLPHFKKTEKKQNSCSSIPNFSLTLVPQI